MQALKNCIPVSDIDDGLKRKLEKDALDVALRGSQALIQAAIPLLCVLGGDTRVLFDKCCALIDKVSRLDAVPSAAISSTLRCMLVLSLLVRHSDYNGQEIAVCISRLFYAHTESLSVISVRALGNIWQKHPSLIMTGNLVRDALASSFVVRNQVLIAIHEFLLCDRRVEPVASLALVGTAAEMGLEAIATSLAHTHLDAVLECVFDNHTRLKAWAVVDFLARHGLVNPVLLMVCLVLFSLLLLLVRMMLLLVLMLALCIVSCSTSSSLVHSSLKECVRASWRLQSRLAFLFSMLSKKLVVGFIKTILSLIETADLAFCMWIVNQLAQWEWTFSFHLLTLLHGLVEILSGAEELAAAVRQGRDTDRVGVYVLLNRLLVHLSHAYSIGFTKIEAFDGTDKGTLVKTSATLFDSNLDPDLVVQEVSLSLTQFLAFVDAGCVDGLSSPARKRKSGSPVRRKRKTPSSTPVSRKSTGKKSTGKKRRKVESDDDQVGAVEFRSRSKRASVGNVDYEESD